MGKSIPYKAEYETQDPRSRRPARAQIDLGQTTSPDPQQRDLSPCPAHTNHRPKRHAEESSSVHQEPTSFNRHISFLHRRLPGRVSASRVQHTSQSAPTPAINIPKLGLSFCWVVEQCRISLVRLDQVTE